VLDLANRLANSERRRQPVLCAKDALLCGWRVLTGQQTFVDLGKLGAKQ